MGAVDRNALRDADLSLMISEGPSVVADHGFTNGAIALSSFEKPLVRPARASLKAEISELSDRQRELAEARERLTATSDILRAIAASPADAEGSLRKIAETTARLFGTVGVSFRIAEGDAFMAVRRRRAPSRSAPISMLTRPNVRPLAAATCRAPSFAETGKFICPILTISMASRRIGTFASLDVMRPRETFSRNTMAPRESRPIM